MAFEFETKLQPNYTSIQLQKASIDSVNSQIYSLKKNLKTRSFYKLFSVIKIDEPFLKRYDEVYTDLWNK